MSDDGCRPCRDGRALLAAGLALRAAWAFKIGQLWGYRPDGFYDDGVFLEGALDLLAGRPLSATHPPGYALFLAPFLALAGGDPATGVTLARGAQMLLSAGAAPLAYRLALSLRLSRGEALIAGAFVAADPMLVHFAPRVMSESLFVFLCLAFLLAWQRAWQSGLARDAVLAGALGGAATLTRGVILPFGAALAAAALWSRREQPRWRTLVAVCGLAWAAALTPWTARNWARHGRPAPSSIQGGWNLYEGLTVDPDEVRFRRARAMGEEARALGLDDPAARDAHFGAKAKAWIAEHPGEFLRLCAAKAVRFWRLAPERPHPAAARAAAGLFHALLFAGALLGLRRLARQPGAAFPLAWVLHLNLLHAVFASNLRYRLPAQPVLAVLAGAGLAARAREAFARMASRDRHT